MGYDTDQPTFRITIRYGPILRSISQKISVALAFLVSDWRLNHSFGFSVCPGLVFKAV